MKYIVSPSKLYKRWRDGEVTVIDCRFVLGKPEEGAAAYETEHIPGAFYLDLEQDMSAPTKEGGQGGRHPLPDLQKLADKLASFGVGPGKPVVGYDEQGGAMASRLWWLLTYMGHEEVYVLDGGLSAWKQAGYPVISGSPQPGGAVEAADRWVPEVRSEMVATAAYIEQRRRLIEAGAIVLIDSREDARYRGIAEPIDKKAGHIPGAKHWFWKANLDAEGRFRPVKEQMERFEPLQGVEEIIVYCGSGVTACPNIVALREAGFTNVKLYAGSWSDWISDDSREIATK